MHVNSADDEDRTLLWVGSLKGHLSVVEDDVQHRGDVDEREKDGVHLLCVVSENGHHSGGAWRVLDRGNTKKAGWNERRGVCVGCERWCE